MKKLKKILIALIAITLYVPCMAASTDEITLMVTSDGQTKDEAVKNALRTAIEQAFGVFVSANTDIMNDEVVKDEIATISSGNIKKFDEIAITNESNKVTATLQVVVSKGKLLSYVKNKGAECELDGNALAGDIELRILYKQNEEIAIQNLIDEFCSQLDNCFDYKIYTNKFPYTEQERRWDYVLPFDLINPDTEYTNTSVSIPYKVTATLNKNGVALISQFIKKLSNIGRLDYSEKEIAEFTKKFQKEYEKLVRHKNMSPEQAEIEAAANIGIDNSFTVKYNSPFAYFEKDKYIDGINTIQKYPAILLRSEYSARMINGMFAKSKNPIVDYLKDFDVDLGIDDCDPNQITTIGEASIFTGNPSTDHSYHHLDSVRDEDGTEYYFRFGIINLPLEDVKKLKNIKVVHK